MAHNIWSTSFDSTDLINCLCKSRKRCSFFSLPLLDHVAYPPFNNVPIASSNGFKLPLVLFGSITGLTIEQDDYNFQCLTRFNERYIVRIQNGVSLRPDLLKKDDQDSVKIILNSTLFVLYPERQERMSRVVTVTDMDNFAICTMQWQQLRKCMELQLHNLDAKKDEIDAKRICIGCKKSFEKFYNCRQCSTEYCSADCQKQDWKVQHKFFCKDAHKTHVVAMAGRATLSALSEVQLGIYGQLLQDPLLPEFKFGVTPDYFAAELSNL